MVGTAGYNENADELAKHYEAIRFEDIYREFLDLFPKPGACAIDIGAGTGRDAAALTERGYEVYAIEPARGLREIGKGLHAQSAVRWIDDELPALPKTQTFNLTFDLILLTAVWMHLDREERKQGMATLHQLAKPHSLICMSLRHGPIPEGRRMFDVFSEEVIALSQPYGFNATRILSKKDMLGRVDVNWTFLALQR